MSNNIWLTKRRKRNRKEKEHDAAVIERSRKPDPKEPSISIGSISDLWLNKAVKNEVIYPDTRFQHSTALFPAMGIGEKSLPPEIPSQTFKRFAEDELGSKMSKKGKMNDPPQTKSTISDDCIIIEKPKARVKVEVIDLTDDTHPIVPTLCSPVKISFQKNKLPLQSLSNVQVKVEPSEKITEINADAVGLADTNYCAVQVEAKQNKNCESNSKVNTDNSRVDFNKNVDPPVDNHFRIHVKTEKSMPSESINYNESHIEHSMENNIQIKSERGITIENDTEVNLENSRNISFRSELDKDNEDNRRINIPIKVEQTTNCEVSDNSASLLNISSNIDITGICAVDRPNSEQNKNSGVELSETPTRNYVNLMSNSPITDGGIFGSDTQLHEKGTFPTPLLKYLNCNMKVDVLEISHALSVINNLIMNKEVNETEREATPDSIDLLDKSEICVGENRKELPDQQVNEKESLKVDEILYKISLSNLMPNITNLDSNSGSFRTNSINEMEEQNPLNSYCLGDEMPQNNSSDILFEPHSNMRESAEKRLNEIAENRKELPDFNGKQSLEYEIPLSNISELVDLEQNIKNSDSNSAFSQSKNYINERQGQSLLKSDNLSDEMRRNNCPDMLFELHSKMSSKRSESSSESNFESHTTYFNSPMDSESPLEDRSPSIICLSSSDNNGESETNNLEIEEKKNQDFLPNDLLRQILGNAKSTENTESYTDSSLKPSVDPVAKSSVIINESLFHNLRKIRLPKTNSVEKVNFAADGNERNSGQTKRKSRNFTKSISIPTENVFKRSKDALVIPPITPAFEAPPKRVKMSEDASITRSGSIKQLNYEEHKRDTLKMASPHHSAGHLLSINLDPDFPSNSPDSSACVSNVGQNSFTTPGNRQNSSFPVCSETSLQDTEYHHLVNTSSPQDPRLARNFSPVLQRNANSKKPLGSFNISQTCPSQSIPDAAKLYVSPLAEQITSGPTASAMQNFSSGVLPPVELFCPINAVQLQQVNPMFPHMNSFQPSYFDQQTSVAYSHIFPAPESVPFSIAQCNPQQSVQCVKDPSPFLPLPHFPGNISVPSPQYLHLSQEIPPPITWNNTLNYDNYSSESINYGFGSNPPLPVGNPPSPPPLPLTPPPNVEQPHFISAAISPSSLLHNNRKLRATKNLSMPKNFSSKSFAPKPSLLPKTLREDIGKNIIPTNDVYLIIIERNIDWIHGIDKEIGVPRMSEIGGEFQQVRSSYVNHLVYYNTYFPLLLLECFSRISTALKAAKQKEKKDRNICKVVQWESRQNYVSLTCDSFIRQSDVENIPKDGHIILVKFAAIPEGSVRMLGYVCSSATRAYSHRHDQGNEILKYANVNKRTDLIKIRINFYIVFDISDINLDVPIHVSKLTSIKKALVLNDALLELHTSPLCNTILGLNNNNIKGFTLPRRQDTNAMTTVIKEIVQSLTLSSSQLTVVKSAPFTDSFLAIVQIVEEIQKSKTSGKILVCVRSEMLCQMGMNLLETSSNVIIINRERESVHERLHSRVLDVKISHTSKAQNIDDVVARSKVLQEAQVLLAVTGTCFYEDVRSLTRNLAYCIIHDAHSFTEPESLLPLLYDIQHLLLFGDPEDSCTVNSKCGASLGYNKSLFHRAYNLC